MIQPRQDPSHQDLTETEVGTPAPFAEALGPMAQAIDVPLLVVDATGSAVHMNARALALYGFATLSEYHTRIAEQPDLLDLSALDGSPLLPEQGPIARALSGATVERVPLRVRRRDTGRAWSGLYSVARVAGLDLYVATISESAVDGAAKSPSFDTPLSTPARPGSTSDPPRSGALIEQALRAAERRRNDFLAMLSRELRSPLTPIRNSLYILDRSLPPGDPAKRATSVIQRQLLQLTRIVEDLLEITRIAKGTLILDRVRTDATDLIRRTADGLRDLFGTSGLDLVLDLPPEAVWLDADPARLAEAVGRVLQNAAASALRGGTVMLHLKSEPGGQVVLIEISDASAGIEPDRLGRVFEPVGQSEGAPPGAAPGLGLGPALVRGLIELHGGSLRVESDGLGKGTRFTLVLPAAPRREARSEPPRPRVDRGNHRILVVEDERDTADTLREALALGGHETAVAYSGPEGLALARSLRPDVILCDIGLPGFDGYELARQVRADPALSSVHLVALTGFALPEDRRRAEEAGFERHIAKPPSPEALDAMLTHLSRTAADA